MSFPLNNFIIDKSRVSIEDTTNTIVKLDLFKIIVIDSMILNYLLEIN